LFLMDLRVQKQLKMALELAFYPKKVTFKE